MLCQLIVEQVNSYLQIVISEINSLPRFLCFYVDNGYYLNKRKISKRLSDRIVYNFRSRNRVSIRLYKEKIRTIRWLSANNSDYTSLVRQKGIIRTFYSSRVIGSDLLFFYDIAKARILGFSLYVIDFNTVSMSWSIQIDCF